MPTSPRPSPSFPASSTILEARPAIQIVMGARVRLLGREISRRPARHYVGRVGATLISSSLGLAVYDTQCGAKVFRRNDTLREVFARPFISRWIFDVEIIARYVQLLGRDAVAASIYELPGHALARRHRLEGEVARLPRAHLRDLWKIQRAYVAYLSNYESTIDNPPMTTTFLSATTAASRSSRSASPAPRS